MHGVILPVLFPSPPHNWFSFWFHFPYKFYYQLIHIYKKIFIGITLFEGQFGENWTFTFSYNPWIVKSYSPWTQCISPFMFFSFISFICVLWFIAYKYLYVLDLYLLHSGKAILSGIFKNLSFWLYLNGI